jgi:primosomal protein N' (replication factor Y)
MYAEVLPNAPITSAFHYAIPPDLEGRLQAGHLVQIPFGRQLLQGLVVGLTDELPGELSEQDLKFIDSLLDSQPVLTRDQIDLGYYMAGRYLAPLSECLFLMLPPGLGKQGDSEYDLTDYTYEAQSDTQSRLIELLRKRGALRGWQIERALAHRNWKPAAAALVRQGVLTRRAVLAPPSVKPKQIRTARLLIPADQAPAAQFRLRASPAAADILDYLFSLWPGQPALADLLKILGIEAAALAPLLEIGWVRLTAPEPVAEAASPADVLRRWIDRHGRAQPEAAAILEALCAEPVVRLADLPAAGARLAELLRPLEAQGLAHQSVNPACVVLNLSGAQVTDNSARLRRPNKRAEVLAYLAGRNEPVPVSWIYAETGATAAHLKDLAERDLVDLGEEELMRDPLAGKVFAPAEPPRLTRDQEAAWQAIGAAFQLSAAARVPAPPFLLHGVTGSGKTEIYLRAAAQALALGRRALILVPEIALTPQTVQRFASRFPGRVAVLHSQLTDGERYDTWRRCRAGAVDVLVGARSALFAPLPGLGLIILDEEHDEAYQQDPPLAPYYHARDVAVEYARRLNAVCLLGSATPDLITHFRALRGDYRLLELPQRVLAHAEYLDQLADRLGRPGVYRPLEAEAGSSARYADLPAAAVVDMRNELRAGNRSLFSRALQAALAATLDRGEQVILFLNRRGQSTFVFCRDCGFVLACARCGTPLTYHGDAANLQCHHCGAARRQPAACPRCRSARIKYFGAGTELVAAELQKLRPGVRALRWDRDTTRERGAHEIILDHFREGRADVLIGTQMVAKGLDLPLVTLVGVVSADVGLNLPDFRSAERVFQVLTQVAGRAGRSALGGQVIIQSYEPEHYAIQAAARHDYAGFYEHELAQRRKLAYPPYARLVRLTYRHTKTDAAETEARRAAALIEARLKAREARATVLIGPAPCFFERINGEYRWQIVLRGPRPAELLRDLPLKDWQVEVDPMSLL